MKKPNLQAPDFLTDLYRDMRDRRLLIPALALIVTALAIPVLLKTDPPAPVPAPSAAGFGRGGGDRGRGSHRAADRLPRLPQAARGTQGA